MSDIVDRLRDRQNPNRAARCVRDDAADEIERLRSERDALLALLPRIREGVGRWRGKRAPLSIPVRTSDADILLADIDAALAAKEKLAEGMR